MTTPSIYVACLASYNSAILHGEWIEVSGDVEDLNEQIQEMLKNSPVEDAEEYAIHDFECFSPFEIDEWDSLETVCKYANVLHKVNENGDLLAFEHWDFLDADQDEETIIENFYESFVGRYESGEDYARELINDCYSFDDFIGRYIDYQDVWRDMDEVESQTFHDSDMGSYVFIYRSNY